MNQTASVKLARKLSLIIAAIFLLLPFHALITTWLGSNTGHLDLIRIWKDISIVVLLPFGLWLGLSNPKTKQWLLNSWLMRLVLAYVLLHFILGLWAYKHGRVDRTALIYALIINLRFVYFFALCAVVASYSGLLKDNWTKLVLWPAAAVISIGLLQKFVLPYDFLKHFGYGPKTIPSYQTVDANIDYARLQSTLRGANPLGAYLILIIPAALISLRKRIYIWAGFIAAALVVLFYSYSRSAIVGLLLAIASFGWILMRRPTRKWVVVGIFGTILISGLYIFFRSNQTVQDVFLHTSKTSASVVSSNKIRNSALRNSTKDILRDPIGEGPGTAGPASFRNSGHTARISENYYLQIGQEVGVLGMAIFVAINILVGRELWLRRRDVLAQVLLASLFGIAFINLVSHAWADDTLSLLWWGLTGVAIATPVVARKARLNT